MAWDTSRPSRMACFAAARLPSVTSFMRSTVVGRAWEMVQDAFSR